MWFSKKQFVSELTAPLGDSLSSQDRERCRGILHKMVNVMDEDILSYTQSIEHQNKLKVFVGCVLYESVIKCIKDNQ